MNTLQRKNKSIEGVLLDARYEIVQDRDSERAEIILYYRDLTGRRNTHRIKEYFPYFFVEANNGEITDVIASNKILSTWVISIEASIGKSYDGGKTLNIVKITGKTPWETPKIRKIFQDLNYHTHEADIPFIHRFMIDNDIYGLRSFRIQNKFITGNNKHDEYQDLKILSFDIEIDIEFDSDNPSESLSNIMDQGSKRITMISYAYGIINSNCKTGVFSLNKDDDNEEKVLIESFWSLVWDEISPDAIITYNGDNFDIPYLLKRMEYLGISPMIMSPHSDSTPIKPGFGRGYTIPGILLFDLFKRTKWLYTEDGRKSLNSIAQVVLGKNKIDIGMSHGEMWKTGLGNPKIMAQLEDYAKMDAKLTYELYFGLGMSEWIDVIKITGSPPREAMYYTQRQAGEFLLYREMYHQQVLIPPTPGSHGKKERDKVRKSAEGGFVFEPKKSIATGVMIADFSSMYPTLMISHNIGAESFKGINHEFKERFNDEPKTTMSLMQKKLLQERLQVKEELKSAENDTERTKQLDRYNWALKIVMNSTIGSYNYTGSRLYNTNISGSVTGLGRTYLQELATIAKSYNSECETIYGDTDSVFIELPAKDQIEKLWQHGKDQKNNLQNHLPELFGLLEYLQTHLPSEMRLDLQDVAYRILFHKGAKKRYSYISAISKQIKILGFEAIRHDWSPFAREAQKKAIEEVLKSGDLIQSKENIIHYLNMKRKQPMNVLRKEFITLGPIKRSPKKYKSLTPGMGAFIHYCEKENLNIDVEWKNYDYFPYLIIKGSSAQYQRSRHPKYVLDDDIDMNFYLQEALNAINRFNLNISLDEVYFEKYDMEEFFSLKTN